MNNHFDMDWNETPATRPTAAEHNEAFRKGLGDAALSLDAQVPPDSAWQPGDAIDIPPTAYPDTLDPEAWVQGMLDDDDARGRPEEPFGNMVEWFRAAIQAGYNAARDLDPAKLYVGGDHE